jgi:hypothetical protein
VRHLKRPRRTTRRWTTTLRRLSVGCRSDLMLSAKKGPRVLLFVVAAGTLALTGCTDTQTGGPSPVSTGPSGTSSAAASASNQSGADSALAAVQPCGLLTTAEAAQFQAQGPGQVDDTSAAGSTSACGWHGRSASGQSVSFGIDIRAGQGVDEVQANGGQLTDGTVNGRTARQLADGNSCILALKVGAHSRVDVSVVVVGDTDSTAACQTASSIANIIEPKLPPEAN